MFSQVILWCNRTFLQRLPPWSIVSPNRIYQKYTTNLVGFPELISTLPHIYLAKNKLWTDLLIRFLIAFLGSHQKNWSCVFIINTEIGEGTSVEIKSVCLSAHVIVCLSSATPMPFKLVLRPSCKPTGINKSLWGGRHQTSNWLINLWVKITIDGWRLNQIQFPLFTLPR